MRLSQRGGQLEAVDVILVLRLRGEGAIAGGERLGEELVLAACKEIDRRREEINSFNLR